MTIMHSE